MGISIDQVIDRESSGSVGCDHDEEKQDERAELKVLPHFQRRQSRQMNADQRARHDGDLKKGRRSCHQTESQQQAAGEMDRDDQMRHRHDCQREASARVEQRQHLVAVGHDVKSLHDQPNPKINPDDIEKNVGMRLHPTSITTRWHRLLEATRQRHPPCSPDKNYYEEKQHQRGKLESLPPDQTIHPWQIDQKHRSGQHRQLSQRRQAHLQSDRQEQPSNDVNVRHQWDHAGPSRSCRHTLKLLGMQQKEDSLHQQPDPEIDPDQVEDYIKVGFQPLIALLHIHEILSDRDKCENQTPGQPMTQLQEVV